MPNELEVLAQKFEAWFHNLELRLHLIHQNQVQVTSGSAATPLGPPPPLTTTTTFGGTEPAGTVTDVPAVETCNGVPVPSGMTLESFTQLVGATSGVAAQLADPNLHASLLAGTQAWWDGFGPYYREEFLAQAKDEVLTALQALESVVAIRYTITTDQQTAANLAAGVK